MKGNQKKIAVREAIAARAENKKLSHDGEARKPKMPRRVKRIPGNNGRWIKIED